LSIEYVAADFIGLKVMHYHCFPIPLSEVSNYRCAFSTVTSMVVAWITVMEGNTSKHLVFLGPVE